MLENENMIDLLGSLKEMSSEQLSRLIQEETAKETPNDDLVLIALDILEDREKEEPVKLGPKGKAAWKKYQSKVRSRHPKTILIWKPLMQAASVVLIITLLFALLPTQANAETWWERLARWTDDFFSFFNPNESDVPEDVYVFQTENKGLQQVYEAVVELGVTEPVVPMWLPSDYSLIELRKLETPTKKSVIATFSSDTGEVVLRINTLNGNERGQYYKDDSTVQQYENYGNIYNIIKNNQNTVVIWSQNNIESAFTIDCQEDVLYKIIESICRWRST